jgi:hypothetical protein
MNFAGQVPLSFVSFSMMSMFQNAERLMPNSGILLLLGKVKFKFLFSFVSMLLPAGIPRMTRKLTRIFALFRPCCKTDARCGGGCVRSSAISPTNAAGERRSVSGRYSVPHYTYVSRTGVICSSIYWRAHGELAVSMFQALVQIFHPGSDVICPASPNGQGRGRRSTDEWPS